MSSSPLRTFLAAMFLSFLLGAATTCSRTTPAISSFQNLAEDKSRLGSTPPSCHNRCNACNPCKAVQVSTTLPEGSSGRTASRAPVANVVGEAAAYAQYSNYKPLGWKCRCAGRLYNP